MLRFLGIFFALSFLTLGSYWLWDNVPEVRHSVNTLLSIGKFQTLEMRYPADRIMKKNKRRLLPDSKHSYLAPTLKFYPYLLMEVKYSTKNSCKTSEGILLWSLISGEMVTNTENWEETHGFGDCIYSQASKEEFKIINALVNNGGKLDRDGLGRAFKNLENDTLNQMIATCLKKNLIVQQGNLFRLHIENPRLDVKPLAFLQQRLVTQRAKSSDCYPAQFHESQIKKIATAVFKNLVIRRQLRVYLPLLLITVENPDGSRTETYWNGVTGKEEVKRILYLE